MRYFHLYVLLVFLSLSLGCAEPPKDHTNLPPGEYVVGPVSKPVTDVSMSDRGEVEILQVRLSALGFNPGPIDNDFGPKTKAALKAFQKSIGFPETGIVDGKTWEKLLLASEAPAHEPPSLPTTVNADWDSKPDGYKWTSYVVKALGSHGVELLKVPKISDAEEFCPKYSSLDINGRLQFYTMLISAMAKRESNHKPETAFKEDFKDAKGNYVISRGLLQISIESGKSYNSSLKAAEDLHDAEKNLVTGVKILTKWVPQHGMIASPAVGDQKGGGKYWSVLRAPKTKDSRKYIASKTKVLKVCQ